MAVKGKGFQQVGPLPDADQARLNLSRKQELADIREVIGTPAGLRYILYNLVWSRAERSVWHPSGSMMARLSGMQDFGHRLWNDVCEAVGDSPERIAALLLELRRQSKEADDAEQRTSHN